MSERAYRRLLDALGDAADIITGPIGARNARERAEGFRNITRVLSVALEMILEKGDRAHPAFTRWINPWRKLLGDNPWTFYDAALIDPKLCYRVHGRRNAPTYLGFCVYGTAEDTAKKGARRIVGNLDDSEMHFEEDGSFELFLGAERPPEARNWIELAADASDLLVRQYFLVPGEQEPATYGIEATPKPPAPEALSEEEFAARLDAVVAWVLDVIHVEATISALAEHSTPHLLRDGEEYAEKEGEAGGPPIDPSYVAKAMPTPAILYTGSWVNDLGDDEVMVVEGRPPKARYWSIQLLSRWMESPDFLHHQVFFTQENTILEPDGSFRVSIAHRDPGVPNWLDTTGLASGNITIRALKAEEQSLDVQFRREKLSG
ncbi:MAG: DUF1214 domain-containing protein [Deltaproteobacteria bacterium]|nr:DUF1214 domain-containing protein [Deltaproteobacteria bacterium]MBW2418255.1 DUF1214 domain-containing protein [Deltaproteobacteria bacterium]